MLLPKLREFPGEVHLISDAVMDSLAGAETHKNGEAHDAVLGQDNNNALRMF